MKPLARISPRGTVAEAFAAARGMRLESSPASPRLPDMVAAAVASFDLDDEVLYQTWELVRCAPGLDASGQAVVAFLVAAALVAARRGSTRLPIEPPGPLDALLASLGANKSQRKAARDLLRAKAGSRGAAEPLFGTGDDYKPLVIEHGCLYLQRLRELEKRLAAVLRERMEAELPPLHRLQDAFDAVIATPPRSGSDEIRLSGEQERAVLAALHLPLAVITGGPGTGKTSIVVTLLRVLARVGFPPESIALAAPTGKAANRMEQSIKKALSSIPSLPEDDRVLLDRCPVPRTLHRLLGYSPIAGRFLHHENNPLGERVVIVDEGSMIDLSLMDRLVRAVDPSISRLVLLGDADQLPSVDSGAVFRDLMPSAGASAPKLSSPPDQSDSKAPDDLRARCTVRLSQSFRQDERDPEGRRILSLAAAINAGRSEDIAGCLTLRSSAAEIELRGVELVACASSSDRDAVLDRWFEERIRGPQPASALHGETWRFEEGQPAAEQCERLEALVRHGDRSRVLCVTRGENRPTGAGAINGAFRLRWLAALGIPPGAEAPPFALGEPIMALRNDYERGLFNGDQGIVLRVQERDGRPATRAVFKRRESWAVHPLGRDGSIEQCFAMTVHKAQGSEYEAVLLVLPDEDIPILTREILYTAVTRARRSVVIVGDPGILSAGVRRPLARYSGLGERLAARVKRRAAG